MIDRRAGFEARVLQAVLASVLLHAGVLLAAFRWEGSAVPGAANGTGGSDRIHVRLDAVPPHDPPAARAPDALQEAGLVAAGGRGTPQGRTVWIDTQRYYAVSELASGPQPLRSLVPASPAYAVDEGRVVASVLVGESGRVDDVTVLSSSPAGIYDESVKAALRNTPFRPGVLAGVPVKSRLTLQITFNPGPSAVAEARNVH